MNDFFTAKAEPWDDPSGQLHVYALPHTALNKALAPYRQAIEGNPAVAVQPVEYLHFTVQRLPFMLAEVRAKTPRLVAAMRQELRNLKPFVMDIGYPIITDDSVVVRGTASQGWLELTGQVRCAIQTVFGDAGLHYAPPALGPHLTVAYGVASGENTDIAARIASVHRTGSLGNRNIPGSISASLDAILGRMRIDSVDLVSVHVNPRKGVYTFDTLAEISFGH